MALTCALLLGGILLVALCRKNSVKFHLQFWGAHVDLEAKGKGE
jgi:hypothetical protein